MVGVVLRGGPSEPLAALGVPADMALAPFAARYRVADFALATLRNSGLRVLGAGVGRPAAPPGALALTAQAVAWGPPLSAPRRGARLLPALRAAAGAGRRDPDAPVVVMVADHVLDADLRPVLRPHHMAGTDLGLLCVQDGGAAAGAYLLDLDPGGAFGVAHTGGATSRPGLAWTGDIVVRPGLVAPLLATLADAGPPDDASLLAALARRHRVVAHDLAAGAGGSRRPYWHEPSTVEAYYGAHMDLCTDAPDLDLYDPRWPLPASSGGLPPAKVVSGDARHAGQALNALLAEGAVIRGGSVIRSVVGRGVHVEVGAEIEDSVLLDGCRVGRGARVRRAVVGAGAVICDGEQVGYDDASAGGARRLPSGLTLIVPSGAPPRWALREPRCVP